LKRKPLIDETLAGQHEPAATLSLALASMAGGLALLTLLFGRSFSSKVPEYLVGATLLVALGSHRIYGQNSKGRGTDPPHRDRQHLEWRARSDGIDTEGYETTTDDDN
jgi:hypothetical protein